MDDLKNSLDQHSLEEIQSELYSFVHSADGYGNRLKLVFALQMLIQESAKLIKTVDSQDFIKDISDRITELSGDAENLKQAYNEQLTQNNAIFNLFSDGAKERVQEIQAEIQALLDEYDGIIKGIVATRDLLPLEKQLKGQKKQ